MTYKLDLEKRLIAIIEKITRLSAVDANDTEKKLTGETQRKRCLVGIDNVLHILLNVLLQAVAFGEFALDIGGKPDLCQWAGLC